MSSPIGAALYANLKAAVSKSMDDFGEANGLPQLRWSSNSLNFRPPFSRNNSENILGQPDETLPRAKRIEIIHQWLDALPWDETTPDQDRRPEAETIHGALFYHGWINGFPISVSTFSVWEIYSEGSGEDPSGGL